MKICSFLPTATTMVYALGLQESLIGVTHECEFPPEAREKPVALRSVFDSAEHSSAEIDRLVRESLGRGESLYRADIDLLKANPPDLLITQEICEVCAISYHEVVAVQEALAGHPRILSVSPHSLEDMLIDLQRLASAAGVPERGEAVVRHLRSRIEAVSESTRDLPRRRVLCLEWFEPIFGAGHWVPELVELAGGAEGLGSKHGNSVELRWDSVVAYQPEVILLMPCGFDVARTERELPLLERLSGWNQLPAVREGQVWAVWGNKYFSGAGPYLVDGLELMAKMLHPERFPGLPDPLDAKRII